MSFVLIDDNDPSVQYNLPGGWTVTGRPEELKGTTHESTRQGDTATLVFEGTYIHVYGTLAPSDGQSRLNFSIDGTDVGSYQPLPVPAAIHNQLFWTSPILDEALHTLVITVDQNTSLPQQVNRTFFLDYFIYNTTSTEGKTVVIDDNDPSVTYSPRWNLDHSDSQLEGTKHASDDKLDGSWVAVAFHGTGISLFGSGLKASVAIDESQAGTLSDSQIADSLFDSGPLPPGPHTINISVHDGHSLIIDYFLVKNDLDPPVAPTANGSASPSVTRVPVPSPSGTTQVSKAPHIAAIVGGTVGGLVLLLLLLVGALLWRRRPRRSNRAAFEYPATSDPWAPKRGSVTTIDNQNQWPKNFEKQRPPSRYMYYEQ